MKITEQQIKEYSELFRKYYDERIFKQKEYKKKHNIEHTRPINSIHDPDYFKIDAEWNNRRTIIDKPILEMAKYKVNQELEFKKTNTWFDNATYENKIEHVLSRGIVTHIHTSDNGSGEIVYCFKKLEPACSEVNPYCLEKDVIHVL